MQPHHSTDISATPTLRQQRVALQRNTGAMAASPAARPAAAAAATAASDPQREILALQSALRLSQQAHASAAAQLQAQAQALALAQAPPPMQAVYATPAAWHRHRQFLLNQPTPKQMPSLAELQQMQQAVPEHALSSDTAALIAQQQQQQCQAADSQSATALAALSASAADARRSSPSYRRASLQSQAHAPPPLLHQRSFSTSPALRGQSGPGAAASDVAADAKLAHVQASLRHLKALQVAYEEEKATQLQKTRIQKTFLSLSSFLIVLFVAVLGYYDYLIVAPHVQSLFWALLFWVLLDAPQRWLLRLFAILDARFLDAHAGRLELFGALVTLVLGLCYSSQLGVLLALGVCFVLYTFFLYGDRHTVTAMLLLLLILLLLAFPLFFLAKTCVLESAEIASRLRAFIEGNPEFQHILEDFSSSATFLWVQRWCRSWGYEIPATDVARLRELILRSIVQFADQLTTILTGVYGLLTNVGNMLVAMVTFASMLYFLLASNRDFSGTLLWLSPFSADDNAKLVTTMKQSVLRIFLCSLSVGILHVLVTYLSFSLCGIDLCLILSFLSGFAAMLPIFSSWVVWLPACGGLLLAGRHASAAMLAAVQVTLLLYVDPLILSNIPGDSYVIGMSIVFAVYAFGAAGVLVGPLLAGVTFTFLSIYKEYLSMPLFTHAPHAVGVGVGVNGAPTAAAVPNVGGAHAHAHAHQSHAGQIGPEYLALGPTTKPNGQPSHDPLAIPSYGNRGNGTQVATSTGSRPLSQPPLSRSASTPTVHERTAAQLFASPLAANPSRTLRFATPLQRGAGTGTGGGDPGASPAPVPLGSPALAATPSNGVLSLHASPLPATPVPMGSSGARHSSLSYLAARQATPGPGPAAESIVEEDSCSTSADLDRSNGSDHGEGSGSGSGAAMGTGADAEMEFEFAGDGELEGHDLSAAATISEAVSPVLMADSSASESASASASASPSLPPSALQPTPISPQLFPGALDPAGLSPAPLLPVSASASSPPSLLSPSPSPLSVGAAAAGLAVRLERARVESAHSRLIAHLEAELRDMQMEQQGVEDELAPLGRGQSDAEGVGAEPTGNLLGLDGDGTAVDDDDNDGDAPSAVSSGRAASAEEETMVTPIAASSASPPASASSARKRRNKKSGRR